MIVTDNTPSQLYALSRKIERAKRPSRSQDGVIWKVLVEKKGDVWVKVDGLWLRQDPKDTVAFDTPLRSQPQSTPRRPCSTKPSASTAISSNAPWPAESRVAIDTMRAASPVVIRATVGVPMAPWPF